MTLVHWDDVEGWDVPEAVRPLGGTWQRLADAAGSVGVGAHRVRVPAGQLLTPPHVHSAEEEIYHLLDGTATLWQDGTTCDVTAGDTIVHVAGAATHALIAGDAGVELLIFGTRRPAETGLLPRIDRIWVGGNAVAATGDRPWRLEAEHGLPEGEPGERPPNVRSLEEAPSAYNGLARYLARDLARETGLNRIVLEPDNEGAPPHCHSAEEEVFVILDGEGVLELWAKPDPANPRQAEPTETHPVRRGHVVSRPPGTRIAHSFRSGPDGLTYLAYGTREPNDIAWYPRSNKVFLRGLGVIARLELLDYFDDEPG